MSLTLGSGATPAFRASSWRAAQIFLILFALPFCAAGVGLAALALRGAAGAAPRQGLLGGIAALTFGGVGFGLIAAALRGGRVAARTEELRRLHPQSPWMWRDDWAAGRVEDSSRRGLVLSWAFALLWNLISAPIFLVLREEVGWKQNRLVLLALAFPIVGALLLAHAARTSLRWRRFGASLFAMGRVPGVVGGTLEGKIRTRLPGSSLEQARLILTCVRRIRRGSGRDRATEEQVVWQEESLVGRASLEPGPSGVDLPVAFAVPPECPPSDDSRPDDAVVWTLRAEARLPGIDYLSQFEIPVFRTAESAPEAAGRAWAPARAVSEAGSTRELPRGIGLEPGSRIRIGPSPQGGLELQFGAARNPGEAIGLTLFLALWAGAIVLMRTLGAPLLFPVVFGCFGVLLLMVAVDLWTRTTRVVIEAGEVRVTNRWLGLGRTRRLPAASVREVKLRIAIQRGGASGTVLYDLALDLTDGKRVVAGRFLRRKREAEWLAFEMLRALSAEGGAAGGAGTEIQGAAAEPEPELTRPASPAGR